MIKHSFYLISLFMFSLTSFASGIQQLEIIGENPGNIDFSLYLPKNIKQNSPLVVIIHGCNQNGESYVNDTGWPKYSELWNFPILIPKQKKSNNPLNCFNWFEAQDIQKGKGEMLSIYNAAKQVIKSHNLQESIYVSGLSAGAAMSVAFAANYPDLVKGVSPHAGLPFQCASGVADAYACMGGRISKTIKEWSSKIKNIHGELKSWPKLLVWQGTSDYTVNSKNAEEIAKQWLGLHSQLQKTNTNLRNGHSKVSYIDSKNIERIQIYYLKNFEHAHGINPGNEIDNCGTEGAYVKKVGVCTAYETALFFGLNK